MKSILILIGMLLPTLGMAQITLERQVVSAGGINSSQSNLQISSTVGEVMVNYNATPMLQVGAGFQQGDSVFLPLGISETGPGFQLLAFPNPTSGVLNLECRTLEEIDLEIEIFALDGRQIALPTHTFHFHGGESQAIDLSVLASGRYFLRFQAMLHGYTEVIPFQKL